MEEMQGLFFPRKSVEPVYQLPVRCHDNEPHETHTARRSFGTSNFAPLPPLDPLPVPIPVLVATAPPDAVFLFFPPPPAPPSTSAPLSRFLLSALMRIHSICSELTADRRSPFELSARSCTEATVGKGKGEAAEAFSRTRLSALIWNVGATGRNLVDQPHPDLTFIYLILIAERAGGVARLDILNLRTPRPILHFPPQ